MLFSSLWVMAQQYEYWLDNDYNHRTTHSVGTGGESFEVDVSQLQPGIHYLNIRARETSEWGAISRYMIYLVDNPVVDSGVSTEYWFDNDYANRHVVEAGSGQISINQDLSSMQPGIHYFNVRTQGQSGQWGAVSRHMLYIYDQPVEKDVTSINYWIDQDSEHQQAVALDNGKAIISIDLNFLAAGEHVLCLRGMTANEPSGMLSTSKFKIGIEDILPWGSEQPWESKYILTEGRSNYVEPSEDANGHKWTELEYDDSAWKTLTGPMADASDRFNEVNYIWEGDDNCVNLRRVFTMDSIPDGNYQLLMAHDDGVKVYLNGQLVVDDDTWGTDYTYDIPQSAFVLGKNILAIYIEEDSGSQYLDYCLRYVEPEHHPEPYAVLSENNTVLTFYYDEKKTERNGIAIGSYGPGNYEPWYENRTTLTTAVFDESFANDTTLTSTAYWFHECIKLTEIKGLEYLKTDKVTDMRNMFYGCSKLTTLDVSHFKTDNVTNMKLMFYYCSGLIGLDVTGFNTENVTDMGSMFNNCSGLTSLDISSFKTEKVKDMIQMFYQCYNLTTIYAGNSWSTVSVTADYGYHMFTDCTALVGGRGTTYDANHIDYTYAHIDGGPNNPGYFTDKNAPVSDDIIQFADANVKAICVNNWDTDGDGELSKAEAANVISLDNAFTGNKDITSFDEFQYFVGVIALGSREFGGCYNLSSIILPPNLKSLEAESLNGNKIDELTIPASVTSIEPSALYATYKNIFVEEGNAYFSSIDGVLFNKDITKIVTYPERKEAESYEIPNTVVTIGRCAFYSSELKSVTIPYGVNTIEGSAFRYCGNLESIDIPGSVETIGYDNFEFANSLTTATIPSSVKSIDTGVFASCQNLQEIIVDTNNQYYTSVDGVLYTKDKTHLVTYPAGKPDENVVIPNYVTSIGQCGVYGCNNIKSVVIPRRVESIGWFAFVNCANLNSVTTHRKKPLELTKTFDDRAQQNGTLYVPYGTKELYQAADEWNGFQNIVELDPSAIISLVNNGDMEGEDNGNFFVRTNYSSGNEEPVQAAISNGVGVNGSRGIKVEATSKLAVSWDNQFWVRLNQPISEGTLYRVSFDYRADKEAMIGAEAHEEPTAYINWGFFGNDLSFTDSWSHFEFEGTMSSLNSKDELPFQSLTFSFNNNFEDANNYYFDNFNFEVMMENQCPKPTFKQKGNEISILSPFNAKIYYTLDGSTPTTSSQVYAGSLKLTENAEINAIAVVEGYEASPVATCKFVHPQFDSNGVLAVTGRTRLSDALEAVGGREEVAKTITAILWEGNYAVYNRELQSLDNPNMLIYVNDESLAPQNRDNVIIGDFAKNIVLTDTKEGNGNFYCPQAFTAEKVSYAREFRQQTQVGVSRGWESIALPFNVQTITHEKQGVIAPFGNSASTKHFWLRRLGDSGLTQATAIEANVPYVISMPNDEVNYAEEFNLSGRVTFIAQEVMIPVTEPVTLALADSTIKMVPAFQSIGRASDVWAINVGETRGKYFEGSVFERDYREVRPFEAYTVHTTDGSAPRFVLITEIGGTTGIEDVRGLMSDDRGENWYDLNGRRLQSKPSQKGVYLHDGRKVVIR